MKPNESSLDRIVRVVIALALGALIYLKIVTGTIAIVAGIAGAIMLVTGLVGFCGIYAIFGLSTCPVKTKK